MLASRFNDNERMDAEMRILVGRAGRRLSPLVVVLLACASPLAAQDERELGWFYSAELTAVFTAGNATSNTFGLGAAIRRVWGRTEGVVRAGGLRTKAGTTSRTAVGTVDDFDVTETTDTRLTAESYFIKSRGDHTLTEMFFAFGGLGWERNTFAGFDSRITAVGGAGNRWVDDDRTRLKTNYGLTYTVQDDVVDDPATADSFVGVELGVELWRRLTETTSVESVLVVDESLAETDDLRADWTNSVLVDISDVLALRASFQILFDHLPSLTTVGLEQPAGTPTGTSVQVPLDKFDTRFTIALVASF